MAEKVIAIIPARYESVRFPGKPLAMICGKPMIQRVFEIAAQSSIIDRVIVATDHERIAEVVQGFGAEVCITSSCHETGTDRIAEVAKKKDARIIVNIQGDEPLLHVEAIEEAVRPIVDDETIPMGTLKTKIRDNEDILNPNVVKVISDTKGFALYFSRSPIPYILSQRSGAVHYRHIGLYVYRNNFLSTFTALPRTPLEQAESLEQLRAIEHGYRIKVSETDYYPLGVDVPEDISRVEKVLKEQENKE